MIDAVKESVLHVFRDYFSSARDRDTDPWDWQSKSRCLSEYFADIPLSPWEVHLVLGYCEKVDLDS